MLTGCHVLWSNVSAAIAAACAHMHTPHPRPDPPPPPLLTHPPEHINTTPPLLPSNSLLAWRCWCIKLDATARSPAKESGFDFCRAKCQLHSDPELVVKCL